MSWPAISHQDSAAYAFSSTALSISSFQISLILQKPEPRQSVLVLTLRSSFSARSSGGHGPNTNRPQHRVMRMVFAQTRALNNEMQSARQLSPPFRRCSLSHRGDTVSSEKTCRMWPTVVPVFPYESRDRKEGSVFISYATLAHWIFVSVASFPALWC